MDSIQTTPAIVLQQEQSPLFQIAPEIRHHIYEHYVVLEFQEHFGDTKASFSRWKKKAAMTPFPEFLLACKRVYRELGPTVYQQAVVRVLPAFTEGDVRLAYFGNLRLSGLRKVTLIIVEGPESSGYWLGYMQRMTNPAVYLKELNIEWRGEGRGLWNAWADEQAEGVTQALGEIALEDKIPDPFVSWVESLADRNLKVVRLRGSFPKSWLEGLSLISNIRVFV